MTTKYFIKVLMWSKTNLQENEFATAEEALEWGVNQLNESFYVVRRSGNTATEVLFYHSSKRTAKELGD